MNDERPVGTDPPDNGMPVNLPRYVRQITVSHRRFGNDIGDRSGNISGLLHPFTGVLGFEVGSRSWPRPALSHLVLGPLVGEHMAGADRGDAGSDGSGDDKSTTVDDIDEEAEEPAVRVRDLVRMEAKQSLEAEQSAEDEQSTEDEPTRSLAELSVRSLESRMVISPSTGVLGLSTHGQRSLESDSVRSFGRFDGNRGSEQAVRSTPRSRRSTPVKSSDNTDDTAADGSDPTAVDHDASESMVVSERRLADTDGPVELELVSTPRQAREGRTGSGVDTAGRLRGSAATSMPRDGTSDSQTESRSGPPRMAVRNRAKSPGTGERDRQADVTNGTDDQPTLGAPTGTSRDRQPRQIDDLVDVERLADRLSHVFERKARIEQERRGR